MRHCSLEEERMPQVGERRAPLHLVFDWSLLVFGINYQQGIVTGLYSEQISRYEKTRRGTVCTRHEQERSPEELSDRKAKEGSPPPPPPRLHATPSRACLLRSDVALDLSKRHQTSLFLLLPLTRGWCFDKGLGGGPGPNA